LLLFLFLSSTLASSAYEGARPQLFSKCQIWQNFNAIFCFSCAVFHILFRTSDGKEVDFVVQRMDGGLAVLEVKAKDTVKAEDFKGLKELQAQTGKDFICGVVLYRSKSCVSFGDRLWAVPINALWE
jgi:predicted AAA+ superfamily ATPase